MFNKAYQEHLEKEVQFLREQVKDLSEKLHVATGITNKVAIEKLPVGTVHVLNELSGKIESINPENTKEAEEKEAALQELFELENVGASFN